MKLGYQDVGSWTLMKSTPVDRRKAAWLYAQFCVAKTTSLEEDHRRPDADPRQRHPLRSRWTELAPKLGGLVEFYRSPARVAWTPTGVNVPGLPEAGPALVGQRRRGGHRREDRRRRRWTASPSSRTSILAAARARRHRRRLRAQAEPGGADAEDWFAKSSRGGRPKRQARQREAAGCHRRLRQPAQAWGDGKVMPEGVKG